MAAGIPRLTLYQIASNPGEIIADAGRSQEQNGKYRGWITFNETRRFRPILSTAPQFDTQEEARAAMQAIVDAAPRWTEKDLEDPSNPLVKFFSSEEGVLVSTIYSATH